MVRSKIEKVDVFHIEQQNYRTGYGTIKQEFAFSKDFLNVCAKILLSSYSVLH
ncbi:MAG: hypothetical protein NPMRth3_3300004, partial [Nitrosopumilales archaeon]